MAASNLFSTDFPLYALLAGPNGRLFAAGGGGQARTGVPNVLEIYNVEESGKKLKCIRVDRIDVGQHAVMNAAVDDNQTYVAIGMDSTCRLMAIREAKLSSKKSTGSPARRRRRTEESRSHADGLTLETVVERQTDFSDQGAFQKCVRFSRSGNALATGGVDSCIRIWTCPDMKLSHTLQGHLDEIDDLDFSSTSNHLVSVSRDQSARAWNLSSGKQEHVLAKDKAVGTKPYRFRACRYGRGKSKQHFYTALIPVRPNGKDSSCIAMWNGKTFDFVRSSKVGHDPITKLEASSGGAYVAIGTSEGSISVYNAENLQLVSKVTGVHQSFITGLAFFDLPLVEKNVTQKNAKRDVIGHETVILSISVDRMCQLTRVKTRLSWEVVLLFLLPLVGIVMCLFVL